MSPPAIQTEKLTRRFGELRAVDRLTMEVPAGCLFGFLGPNGSGKTTTIRLLLGLLEPSEGRASVLGLELPGRAEEIRRRSGVLFEQSGLYERMTAAENLEFHARIRGISARERARRIGELLEHFSLSGRERELPLRWSRGMRQKLALARAVLHRPSLLFLDEPTAGLDPTAAASLRRDLQRLVAEERITVFLTTHNLAEAEQICSLVAVIHQGRLVAFGAPDALGRRPLLKVVGRGFAPPLLALLRDRPGVSGLHAENGCLRLDLRPEADVPELIKLMVDESARIEEVYKDTASLEEVFLALTREES